MNHLRMIALLAAGLAGGCATVPDGPSVMVLPGHGKSFERFQADDVVCRDFALRSVGGVTAQRALNESTAATAATTAVLGAAVGAAADGGRGAGIGAASGALLGTAVGSGTGSSAAWDAQRRYDHAYQQCMYAKGHQIPVTDAWGRGPSRGYYVVPPPPSGWTTSSDIPPPPPGSPPPPPPGQ